jgi:hypothetical protein
VGCHRGGECALTDGLEVALRDVLAGTAVDERPGGLRIRLDSILAGWYDCDKGRRRLDRTLRVAETGNCNAVGTVLLIAAEYGIDARRQIELLTTGR